MIYGNGNKIYTIGGKPAWTEYDFPAANTIRFKFANAGYDPSGVGASGLSMIWKRVASSPNIWDCTIRGNSWTFAFEDAFTANTSGNTEVLAANTDNVTGMFGTFDGCSALTRVALFNTENVTTLQSFMYGCSSLVELPAFNTANVTSMETAFVGCSSLTTVPLFNTAKVVSLSRAFEGCTSLREIPLFSTESVRSMGSAFKNCYLVERGALALYQQASTQTTPPTWHFDCFYRCGRDTVSGAQELASIPTNWGGTMSNQSGDIEIEEE